MSRGDGGCLGSIAGGVILLVVCVGAGTWLYDLVGRWVFWPLVAVAGFAFLRMLWREARRRG